MEFSVVLLALFLIQVVCSPVLIYSDIIETTHTSSPFPSKFLFGTASSAYQFEGAFLKDGKGLSNWDVFTHQPGTIMDGTNGDVAIDQYHLYLEDINLMHSLGVGSHRFSISWARVLPKGRFGDINHGGIKYYNNLINALLRKGIEPFVTLTHYDSPQVLEDVYQGWLNPQMQEEFRHFADICFEAFGDRVKFWSTFNEPAIVAMYGYRTGRHPPCRCSGSFGNCTEGDSETEPFIAAHNILLSHAAAVDTYRTKYQRKQGGSIGIAVSAIWFEPISDSSADKLAVQRAHAFNQNWFLDPVIFGKYPIEMQEILGSRLPKFSREDQKKLKGSLDFIGVNHYTSLYVKDCIYSPCEVGMGSSMTEGFVLQIGEKDGVSIGEPAPMKYYYVCPEGMEKVVTYLKDKYDNIPMFITENGYADDNNLNATIEDFLHDMKRVDYMSGYLDALASAVRKGADVRGYFTWSLLDNFEWTYGYTKRFGLHYVDFKTLKRTPKLSATWYKNFIQKHLGMNTVVPKKNGMHSEY